MNMNCIECGNKLQWGKFSYNQDMCYDCYKTNVEEIIANIGKFYPSWLWGKTEQHQSIIRYAMAVVEERCSIKTRG